MSKSPYRSLVFSVALILGGLVATAPAHLPNTPIARAAATAAGGVPRPDHVVIVMEENHAYSSIIGAAAAPYINSLAAGGASFTDAHGVEHPSQPNYLDIFAGSNQGITNDTCPHTFATANLGSALIAAGRSFAGYSEDLPAAGSTVCTSGGYARKHNPWADFTNVPAGDNLPFTRFPTDYTTLPSVAFVVPNLTNDMHDGTIQQGDTWLQQHLDGYVQWARTHNSLLIVTWDEDDFTSTNQVATIFNGALVQAGQYAETINHYNVLRTIEDMYGLPYAGQSSTAAPIIDIWSTTGPTTTPTLVPTNSPTATPTAVSTNTPGPTFTNTPVPPATATPAPTITPGGSLANGDFETGNLSAWTVDGTSNAPVITTAQTHGGSYAVLVGSGSGSEPSGNSSLYQQLTVPAAGGTLSFWYRPQTADTITYDWQDAYVTDTSGTVLATLLHIAGNSQTWTNVTYNMAAYAGKMVRVKFLVHQDGCTCNDDTAMYIDDVSLTGANNPTPTNTPAAIPTNTPPPTNTAAPSPTNTLPPTNTAVPSSTNTPATGPTNTPPPTNTAVPSPTNTPTPLPTNTPPATGNLVVNGGFESGSISPWTTNLGGGSAAVTTSAVHTGSYSANLTSGATAGSSSGVGGGGSCPGGARIPITAGTSYAFSGWILVPTGTNLASARIRIAWYAACTGGSQIATNDSNLLTSAGGSWTQVSGSATAPGTAGYAEVRLYVAPAGASPIHVYFDDVNMH